LAQFALLAILAFIYIALRQDARESRNVSRAIWIPFLWLATSASQPLSGWLNPGRKTAALSEIDYLQGNPIERIFLPVMLLLGLSILMRRSRKAAYYFRDNASLYFFLIYAFISIGWSDYQGMSFRRWIRLAVDAIMVLVILTEEDQLEAITRVLRRCAIVLIPLSFLYIRYFSHWGVAYHVDGSRMWIGVTTHKNTLGIMCAFLGIFLTWRLIQEWRKPHVLLLDGFLWLLSLYLLRGSRSATSLVVYVVGLAILLSTYLFRGDKKKLNSLLIAAFIILLALQVVFVAVLDTSLSSAFFAATERDASLTGRLPLWEELLKIGSQRPLLGSGYGGIWLDERNRGSSLFDFRHKINAHNGYIHIFMDLGLLGLSLVLILIAQTYKRLLKVIESHWQKGALLLTLFLMIVFHNLSESTLTRGTSFLWLLFLLASFCVYQKPDPSVASGETADL
jgi:exopolysaccharide production protein ExoQ